MVKVIHPNPVVKIAKALLVAVLLTVALYVLRDYTRDVFGWALAIIWGIALLSCLLAFISTMFVTLEISENDLVFKKGILAVKTVLVPYNRVSDTRYNQSIVERLFGVGTLEVETASESGVAIRIPAVRYDDVKGIMQSVTGSSGARK
jgi:uncharacterized membrane protein YdbT with pleckstrin-like domain